MADDLELFVTTLPGLEDVLAAEIAGLRPGGRRVAGGVELTGGGPADVMRLNLELRTASRVLLRAAAFRAATFADLRRRAAAVPWERWLRGGARLALRVTCRQSRLWHGGAVAERLADAVADRLGEPVILVTGDDAPADALVVATVLRDAVRVSVDSSGEPLHRRGWRLATAKAPLRETLAAALVILSGWDRRAPLVDPFCGSGTIAIEAALLARGAAPGVARRFAFERWPGHDAAAWASLCDRARSREVEAPAAIVASDRDAGAVRATLDNAERAGVLADLAVLERSVSDLAPPPGGPGAVATNPPHGRRISGGRDLVPLYGRFGAVLRKRLPGWRVAFLTSSVRYQTATRLLVREVRRLDQGGQPVRLVLAESRGEGLSDRSSRRMLFTEQGP